MSRVVDASLRVVLTAAHHAYRLALLFRRKRTSGAHAIALTPEGQVILVKLRYAPGWRLPGGGRPAGEPPMEAAIRELREEVGMISHGDVRAASLSAEAAREGLGTMSLAIVRDVQYRPRWSWEVEQVCEADLDALPRDLSEKTRIWIEEVRPLL